MRPYSEGLPYLSGALALLFQNACLESLGYVLPDEVVESDELEARLAPLYERLRLPAGRLELMSGIRQRRFWSPGTLPSEMSIASGKEAIRASGVPRDSIGVLVHASVCRDHLEPATASIVHRGLGLDSRCLVYDVSNACLGFLNGLLQVASLIELGQVRSGLVVSSEGSRELVETTIAHLNRDTSLTRASVKLAVASLTIGSASVAAVVTHRDQSRSQTRLVGAAAGAYTAYADLCRSGRDEAAADGMSPLMTTDSEALLAAGVDAARDCFMRFVAATGWGPDRLDKTCCHQVGQAHRRALLEALGLSAKSDFTTYERLGNTGSAALPITLALAAQHDFLEVGDRTALLGIGSGINCVMLGLRWGQTAVRGIGHYEVEAGLRQSSLAPGA